MIQENSSNVVCLSIVIPCFNEEDNIVRCVDSILSQKDHSIEYEVIIVDDCSTDRSVSVVKQYFNDKKFDRFRVLQLSENSGRFKARLTGIRAARYPLIMLIDSKVTLGAGAFDCIEKHRRFPLQGTNSVDHNFGAVNKVLDIIRRRVYGGNFPKIRGSECIDLTPDSFNALPKGTTLLVCPKSILLENVPGNISKDSSDDTAWLWRICQTHPIIIRNDFEFCYHPRTRILDIIAHLFYRGPKFVDYYWKPGRPYSRLLHFYAVMLVVLFVGLFVEPAFTIIFATIVFVLAVMLLALYVSESIYEFVMCLLLLPAIVLSFGAGVAYGMVKKLGAFSH
jgi:glycosyltransferase involved in cell wall biosynthesis